MKVKHLIGTIGIVFLGYCSWQSFFVIGFDFGGSFPGYHNAMCNVGAIFASAIVFGFILVFLEKNWNKKIF